MCLLAQSALWMLSNEYKRESMASEQHQFNRRNKERHIKVEGVDENKIIRPNAIA